MVGTQHTFFRVSPVMTTSITLRVYFNLLFNQKIFGENTEKYSIFNFENPYKWGISDRRNAMKISCHIGFIFKNDNIVNYINFLDLFLKMTT